jgi:hypothetical protein
MVSKNQRRSRKHSNLAPDFDGAIRKIPLLSSYVANKFHRKKDLLNCRAEREFSVLDPVVGTAAGSYHSMLTSFRGEVDS